MELGCCGFLSECSGSTPAAVIKILPKSSLGRQVCQVYSSRESPVFWGSQGRNLREPYPETRAKREHRQRSMLTLSQLPPLLQGSGVPPRLCPQWAGSSCQLRVKTTLWVHVLFAAAVLGMTAGDVKNRECLTVSPYTTPATSVRYWALGKH